MLQKKITEAELRSALLCKNDWRPFPALGEKLAWQELSRHPLNQFRRGWILKEAERALAEPWPQILLTQGFEFKRSGNRRVFEKPYFARRQSLAFWALAECFEGQGRFTEALLNGVWALCEEASWCISAHARYEGDDPMPLSDPPVVDLFAAETAADLSALLGLIENEFLKISPAFCQHLRKEIKRRVLEPVLKEDFGWMKGRNNWSTWCAASTLSAALIVEEDQDCLAKLVWKLMGVIDRFIEHQVSDGSCEEGPMYWQLAAGQMLVFLELLYLRTDGRISIYDEPIIKELGEFPCKVHLAGPYFVNFGDAVGRLDSFLRAVTFRYGERTQSQELRDFAFFAASNWGRGGLPDPPLCTFSCATPLSNMLRELFWMPSEVPVVTIRKKRSVWLPDLQLMVARESEEADKGLILVAKGGHNAACHNHNDIGHFSIYFNGKPIIIDLGTEAYCRATFSPERYQLLCTRGASHNAPMVNGVEQMAGGEHRAENVSFEEGPSGYSLGMDLEKIYPSTAGVKKLRRVCSLKTDGTSLVFIEDELFLSEPGACIALNLYSAVEAVEQSPGLLRFSSLPSSLFMQFAAERFTVAIEKIHLSDTSMITSWGTQIWKIALNAVSPSQNFKYKFCFSEDARKEN